MSYVETAGNYFKLDTSASSDDDYYNGMPIYIFAGGGAGATYRVKNYIGSTKNATVDTVEDDNLTDVDSNVLADNLTLNTTSFYDAGFIPRQFEINDISIIYRDKPIK